MSKNRFLIKNGKTYLNGQEFLARGLRCSNALFSEEVTSELIANLRVYASYEVNTISVYFMGNRFGDVEGYDESGRLKQVYAERMGKIIEAADRLDMVVLVGCLYWGNSKAKWDHWTQKEANRAVYDTAAWLKANHYRNVFVDVDNEGMAKREMGFNNREMVLAGKRADPDCIIATNCHGVPPEEADLAIHFSDTVDGKPYIETEGTPDNAPGGYWGSYSKREGLYNYINVGVYTPEMKENQKELTVNMLNNGDGYLLASTWLQARPPKGPNHSPGGRGTKDDPGIRWWLEYLKYCSTSGDMMGTEG